MYKANLQDTYPHDNRQCNLCPALNLKALENQSWEDSQGNVSDDVHQHTPISKTRLGG
jgi:hypothetical protein